MEAHSYNIRTPENDSRINVCELSQRGARRLKFRFPGISPDRAVAPRGALTTLLKIRCTVILLLFRSSGWVS